jgi:hypothetical protein
MKLAYAERVSLVEPAALTGILSSFSLNSVYDPNSGGVGAQPVGFDQMSTMYGQFRVWGAKFKITCSNLTQTGVNPTPAMVCLFGTYQPAAPTNPNSWFCQPYGVSSFLSAGDGGSAVKTLEYTFDIPQVLGLTKEQYRDDMDFVGTPSGNPTRQAYAMFGHCGMSALTSTVAYFVQVVYDVEFCRPLALDLS